MHPRHDRPCKHSDSQIAVLSHGSDAEQSLNARRSELVLMRVYFTQQQQIKKKKKGAKFLDRACVRAIYFPLSVDSTDSDRVAAG
jgi:hypothetical protein